MGAPQAVGGTVSEAEGKSADAGKESAVATSVDPFETAKATAAAASSSPLRQEVLVLRDGFQGWQGLYRVRVSSLSFSLCSLFRAFLSLLWPEVDADSALVLLHCAERPRPGREL